MIDRRRWTILAVGTFAQAATCTFIYGIPMLVPRLRDEGLTLFQTGLLVSAPMAGVLLTLIFWGALADRHGERIVIVSGVGAAAVVLGVATAIDGPGALGVLLVVAGAFGASVNAASGRVVMGWFSVQERGLAMGIRQTAQPLGVALAALALPPIAHAHGSHLALLFPAVLCALAATAVLVFVTDPPRPPRVDGAPPSRSPYRDSRTLARVHVASSLLVVPQFAIVAFTLVYLVGERGWDASVAGRWIFGFTIAGAVGRVASGIWTDRVGSRLRPIRQLAVVCVALMLGLSLGAALDAWWIVPLFAFASVITVADNGPAYIAVAELAGTEWSGRALGVQNTLQNATAVLVAPILAAIIGDTRYALGFAVVAIAPLLATMVVPVRAERSNDETVEAEERVIDRRDVDA